MAASPIYCTVRDVKDVFPNVDQYDDKTPIYGWVATGVTNQYQSGNSGKITNLFEDGVNLGATEADLSTVTTNAKWFYDADTDVCYYFNDVDNPVDLLMEAGEDYDTLLTRNMSNASRYFDSRVDAGIPRDMFKNRKGVFDYMIVRTTSLLSSYFIAQAKEPGSELANAFLEEANFNIEQINTGKTKLSYQVSSDSSSGVLRDVSTIASGSLRIVDTRGSYKGVYDCLKIIITTAGAIGIAKFDVYAGDNQGIKTNKIVDGQIISGLYQSIGSGLQIRFAGLDSDSASVLDDEWEMEVWGIKESMDGSPGSGRNTQMTRS
jgi:hypothetical protein